MKIGVSKKVSLLFILLVITLGAVLGYYFLKYQKEILFLEFDERAKVLLSSLAVSSEYPVLVENKETLDKIGKGILKQKDVVFCEIRDRERKILFQQGSKKGTYIREYTLPILIGRMAESADEKLILGFKETETEEIGKIYLVLSLASLMNKLNDVKQTMGILVIVAIVLASIFITLLVRFVLSRPIGELIRGIEKISRGDLDYKVPLKTNDEIGVLANSFNKMTENLKKTTVSRDHLDGLVKERTAKLTAANKQLEREIMERRRVEKELLIAKKEAEIASQAKGDFLANMSHEIRTPMNAVIGMTELVLDTEITDEQQDYLSAIRDNSYSLLRLINDVLDFSKIEARKLELEIADFDITNIVEGVAQILAHRASEKGVELLSMINGEFPFMLQGDFARLRQILINLGGNAIKFTEEGEVIIRAELKEETSSQATVLFSVSDTGIGIPKEKQDKIFEPFFQVDSSMARRYEGTGLGLSIVSHLVELMEGEIGVESRPQGGSRFWFTTIFKKGKEVKPIPTILPPRLHEMRMLVVDDNATNRIILSRMLASFGCVAQAVESGQEAIQLLKGAVTSGNPFSLVLLDMHMPQMDGEQVLRLIKGDPEIREISVIILTSMGKKKHIPSLESLGCAAYLVKPVRQSQLFDTIVTVLGEEITKEELPLPSGSEELPEGLRILLAEDNPINQKLAVVLLQKVGCQVDAVENGRLAVTAIKKASYDMVLMDVQMPEMDGFEATRLIREWEEKLPERIPIVAITAHAMKGDRERCLEAGMDDYISKPINRQELFEVISKWTRSRYHDPQDKDVPIDLKSALLRFDDDRAFFKEMLQDFLNDVPRQLQTLMAAVKAGDSGKIELEAHSLKGAAGTLSAEGVQKLAMKLEMMGRDGKLDDASEALNKLKAELERLQRFVKALG